MSVQIGPAWVGMFIAQLILMLTHIRAYEEPDRWEFSTGDEPSRVDTGNCQDYEPEPSHYLGQ